MTDLLSEAGFKVGRANEVEPSVSFTRLREDQVYELIRCSFAGKKREAAVCRIGASVTRVVELKGLSENELLLDVAQNRERGWTIVERDQQLGEWAKSVASVGVPSVRRFADRVAAELLGRTECARVKASRCFSELKGLGAPSEVYQLLMNSSSRAELDLSQRLSEWPGVMQISGSEFEYRLACLAVVKIVRRNDLPDPSNVEDMPLQNPQLMWEIQLMADRWLGERLAEA